MNCPFCEKPVKSFVRGGFWTCNRCGISKGVNVYITYEQSNVFKRGFQVPVGTMIVRNENPE